VEDVLETLKAGKRKRAQRVLEGDVSRDELSRSRDKYQDKMSTLVKAFNTLKKQNKADLLQQGAGSGVGLSL
jgi:hypothetical protein